MKVVSKKEFFSMMRSKGSHITISGDWQWAILDDKDRLIRVTNTDPEGSDMVEDRADMDWLAVPEE